MRYYDRALREAGHEVTIISVPMHPENSNKTVDNVHYTNYFASLSYDLNLIFSIPRLYAKCVELNKSCAFDVVHSLYREFCGIAGVLLKWRLGLPLVQWMYDLGYESQKASLLETGRSRWATPLLLAYLKYGEKLVLGTADRILAIGPDIIEKSLRPRNYVEPQVVLVNNTVDPVQFCPRAAESDIRSQYGLNSPLVLMISRLDPLKGISEFVDIAAAVVQERADVNFLVLGKDKDNLLPGYKEKAARVGLTDSIHWHPEREDIERVYPLADCVVICTRASAGGTSNVLLEALASGKPVVANRAAAIPYVIKDWENGVSIPDNDPGPFSQAILRILSDDAVASTLGKNARRTILEGFTLNESVKTLIATYEELLVSRE